MHGLNFTMSAAGAGTAIAGQASGPDTGESARTRLDVAQRRPCTDVVVGHVARSLVGMLGSPDTGESARTRLDVAQRRPCTDVVVGHVARSLVGSSQP